MLNFVTVKCWHFYNHSALLLLLFFFSPIHKNIAVYQNVRWKQSKNVELYVFKSIKDVATSLHLQNLDCSLRSSNISMLGLAATYPVFNILLSCFSSASNSERFVSHSSTLSTAIVSSPATSCSTCSRRTWDGIFSEPLYKKILSLYLHWVYIYNMNQLAKVSV